MKKTIFTALCAIMMALCTTTVMAQPNGNPDKQQQKQINRERMAEAQAKYMSSQLALDDATSQKFIATFTEYQKEVWAMKKDLRIEKGKDMTEADAEKNIKNQMERKRRMLDLKEKYYKKYSQFLTQKQIQRVFDMEKEEMDRLSAGKKGHGHHHHGGGHHFGKPHNNMQK